MGGNYILLVFSAATWTSVEDYVNFASFYSFLFCALCIFEFPCPPSVIFIYSLSFTSALSFRLSFPFTPHSAQSPPSPPPSLPHLAMFVYLSSSYLAPFSFECLAQNSDRGETYLPITARCALKHRAPTYFS